jgi:hypothetical protein
MAKGSYILIYHIHDYPDNGGGINWEEFENEQSMTEKVNELCEEYNDIFEIIKAGYLFQECKYIPKEKVISYQVEGR